MACLSEAEKGVIEAAGLYHFVIFAILNGKSAGYVSFTVQIDGKLQSAAQTIPGFLRISSPLSCDSVKLISQPGPVTKGRLISTEWVGEDSKIFG